LCQRLDEKGGVKQPYGRNREAVKGKGAGGKKSSSKGGSAKGVE
jgi:hypothetical protein